MGLIRGLVSLILTAVLVLTVTIAHVVTLSEKTIFEQRLGEQLLAQTPVTLAQVHLASLGTIAFGLLVLGLLYLVVRSAGTVARRLGFSLVLSATPFYAVSYVLQNLPGPVLSTLGRSEQQVLLELAQFTRPFIDTVAQQSLLVLASGAVLIAASFVINTAITRSGMGTT